MKSETDQSLAQLNKEAWQALVKELGVVKAIRFIGPFEVGSGKHATDRDKWQKGLTLEDIVASIERRKLARRGKQRFPQARRKKE
jgi:hypothetical protein